MVHDSPDSPYTKLMAPFVAKKQHLGLDFWDVVDETGLAGTYEPFIDDLRAMVPEHIRNSTYPRTWSFDRRHIERLVREGFLSDLLNLEFAELFRGKTQGGTRRAGCEFPLRELRQAAWLEPGHEGGCCVEYSNVYMF
ncbi:hypothetical protein MBLNU230_g1854t1 [Neophaeotheca triangularis]